MEQSGKISEYDGKGKGWEKEKGEKPRNEQLIQRRNSDKRERKEDNFPSSQMLQGKQLRPDKAGVTGLT
ncbi:hypothetical protein E2C01_026822 [Portunus trituberculatus]|uniref:Uncharacterized protein n=1 Tax=Portunus trituberculatus TaxID=210409 RepID=A0A5B7EGB5_PORTR|nr:hypothetical protein [Portunus trituberculatus]